MTKQSTATQVEDLAQEAANIPATGEKPLAGEVSELLTRLARENEAMKGEIQAMKHRVQGGLKTGKDELKTEIAHHPMQSVATAFALGFIASLVVRR